MCIRDRPGLFGDRDELRGLQQPQFGVVPAQQRLDAGEATVCLLYTSDAADERSSVDLGGRRIIKKKICVGLGGESCDTTNVPEDRCKRGQSKN